jgi:hypothetical protein
MYSYMKKAETFHQPSKTVASLFDIHPSASDYGSNGPVQVSFNKQVMSLCLTYHILIEISFTDMSRCWVRSGFRL